MEATDICRALSNAAIAAERYDAKHAAEMWDRADWWAKVCAAPQEDK